MAKDIKLVCFDMDGTLVRNTNSVRYLCSLNGRDKEVDEIEEQEEGKEFSWIEADFRKARLIAGLKVKEVKENFDQKVHLIDNIEEVLKELKVRNIRSILVTAGPIQVAEVMGERFSFDRVYGSNYEVKNGIFTGEIIKHLGTKGKLNSLLDYCTENNIELEKCAAVGDSESDTDIFFHCGQSIAVNYSDTLLGKADHYIRTEDLRDILLFL